MITSKPSFYFIKLYTKYLTNIKFNKLPLDTRYVFVGMYLIAQTCDMSGLLIQDGNVLLDDDIAMLLFADKNTVKKSIKELISSKFIVEENGGYGIDSDIYIEEQGSVGFGEKGDKARNKWREDKRKQRGKNMTTEKEDTNVEEKNNNLFPLGYEEPFVEDDDPESPPF